MFKYRERMLSVVIRWSVLPRLHDQSVAEHSYYVTLYTEELCKLLQLGPVVRYEAMSYALRHDLGEVIIGDIMGPVKRLIANHDELEKLNHSALTELGHSSDKPAKLLLDVVKAANCIDEYFWLSMEVSSGNRSVRQMHRVVEGRMRLALKKIELEYLMTTLVNEYDAMDQGLGFPQKDTDLG